MLCGTVLSYLNFLRDREGICTVPGLLPRNELKY